MLSGAHLSGVVGAAVGFGTGLVLGLSGGFFIVASGIALGLIQIAR